MTLGKLISPLSLDLDELLLELEGLPLYDEFTERFHDALYLVADGIEMWRSHEGEEWAIEAAAEINRKFYNIEQRLSFASPLGIPSAVRSVGLSDSRITDSQYVAAYAMACGCQAINVLRRWQAQLADEVVEASGHTLVDDTIMNYPDVYAAIINDRRLEDPIAEIEARESAADLLGRARTAMIMAELYRNPSIPPDALARFSERAVRRSFAATGRKAGERSGAARREKNAERDRAICDAGRKLLKAGRSPSEISGIISGLEVAKSLGSKSVLAVLRRGGVLPPA